MTIRMFGIDRLCGELNADEADNIGDAVGQGVKPVGRQTGASDQLPHNDFNSCNSQIGGKNNPQNPFDFSHFVGWHDHFFPFNAGFDNNLCEICF